MQNVLSLGSYATAVVLRYKKAALSALQAAAHQLAILRDSPCEHCCFYWRIAHVRWQAPCQRPNTSLRGRLARALRSRGVGQ